MFFKNRVTIADYCNGKLTPLFSSERETIWQSLRTRCADPYLNQADASLYYNNLRAALITLLRISISRNCSVDISTRARGFTVDYLDKRGLTEVHSLCGDYSRAFGSSNTDGIHQMVALFSNKLAQSKMGELAKQQFYTEFCVILQKLFDEFTSIKLVI